MNKKGLKHLKKYAKTQQAEITSALNFYIENKIYGAIASSLNNLAYWEGYLSAIREIEMTEADILKDTADILKDVAEEEKEE